MDDIYLVEIRLARTKWRIRETIFTIGRLFPIGNFMEKHPHVTLFGPLTLNEGIDSHQLLDTIGRIAVHYDPIPFTIDGWEKREGMHGSVIAFSVLPSEMLKRITAEIARELPSIVQSLNVWDNEPDKKWFHVTVANRLDAKRASDIFAALTGQDQELPEHDGTSGRILTHLLNFLRFKRVQERSHTINPALLDETGLRITVLQGDKILAEYDLLEKCWIFGDHSHSNKSWQKTLSLFRQRSGFERADPLLSGPDNIYLISDLHLGHANIIRYCARPFLFPDVQEMDHVLIKNWNYTISPQNRVYYLGDLRYGRDAVPAQQYLRKLKGRIIFINGNHDDPVPGSVPSVTLEHEGILFHLVHDPADSPAHFEGWVIHGHHHNCNLCTYPFIDYTHKRINVSAEVIGYTPISLQEICSRIREQETDESDGPVLLRYPHIS
jgi:calcineurin-like phosphoesterase family protein